MVEERQVYVKCSNCKYEGMVLIVGNTSIYETPCPQCGQRTLFLMLFSADSVH